MSGVSSARRTLSAVNAEEAAGVLRRFMEAVESGELLARTPQDAVVVRRLHEALTALATAEGEPARGPQDPGGTPSHDA